MSEKKPINKGSTSKNSALVTNRNSSIKSKGSSKEAPVILKSGKEDKTSNGRSVRMNDIAKPVENVKTPRKSRSNENKQKKSKAQEKKKKPRARQKTFYEKFALFFGFYIGEVVLRDPRAIEAAQALNLKQWHLRRLKAKFDRIDIDGSGNIDYEEFFEAMGEERSPFSDKLFSLIDLDGSGTIEFDEFVRVLATYCMFTKDEILRFCFECFDVDHSGSIDEKEFIELCKCINNASPSFPNNFRRALEEFDVNEDGLIDYSEFVEIDRRYPLVLFPAFRLQDVMQRNTLGK
jgi:Ca2+-binding EF-hand superfamily protein